MKDQPRNDEASEDRRHNGRVLVVEDDGDLCCFLGECLERAGYRAILSNNGLEGLRAFEEERPHLAVVDLNMPVMSGYRLLGLLRRRGAKTDPRVPVVVISGEDPMEAMEIIVEAKPDAYLQKPFAPGQLLERVGHLLPINPTSGWTWEPMTRRG